MDKQIKLNITKKLEKRTQNASRGTDIGMVNDNAETSMLLRGNGDVVVASSKNAQYKLRKADNTASEISFQSNTITNRKNIRTNDLTINNHKMNPSIYQMTDMNEMFDDSSLGIGNLTMGGYVLVKTWEIALKKWVLIRRPMRTPLFSNTLNVAGAIKESDIDDKITREEVTPD